MYIRSKFEDSTPRGYSETELNATGECFAYALKGACSCERRRTLKILHKPAFCEVTLERMIKMHKPLIIGLNVFEETVR